MRRVPALFAAALLLVSCGPSGTSAVSRPFYGLNEPYASLTLEQKRSEQLGVRPTVFSAFIRLDTTTTAQKMRAMRGAGFTPFITIEPWHLGDRQDVADPRDSLRRVIAGDVDHELTAQARMLATYGRPFYLRFAHEMNAHWYPWGLGTQGNTAAEYVRAWRHVHRLFAAVTDLQARWVWSPVIIQNPGASADLGALYPGDDVVDFAGLTGYEHAGSHPAQTFDHTLARLRTVTHRPVVLSEIGTDAPGKGAWLAALGPYLRQRPAVAGFVYFDTTPATTGATGAYALDQPTDRAAFRRSLRSLAAATDRP